MSIRASNLLPDGFSTVALGVNSDLAPNILPPQQIAWLVNGQTRRNFIGQRPGWARRLLSGDSIPLGLFQGASLFTRFEQLVLSLGGHIYAVNLNTYAVTRLTTEATRNPSNRRRAWFCEVEDFLIIQDGQSGAFIYDGSSLVRADESKFQVPTGTCMAYAQGRLWVTLPDQRSYVGSDLVYGSSGTGKYGLRDAILYFTENTLIAGGGAFGVPFRSGAIVAMVPLAQTDTSLGQGPLQVFCTAGAFSVNAPYLRAAWSEVTFPIQSASLLGNGATSDWATVNVNGDVWYRSPDGARSFQVTRRETNTWSNTPLSSEVARSFEKDIDPSLLAWSSAARFDNRLLFSIGGSISYDYGVTFRGLAVLDFVPVSSITDREQPPVWDGEWSGLRILQVLSEQFGTQDRGFILALDPLHAFQLWELTTNASWDNDGTHDRLITWELEGASYGFKDKGWSLKQLEWGDIFYDQLEGTVNFSVFFRPDQEPRWQEWHSWSSCALTQTCDAEIDPATGCAPAPPTLAPQYRVSHRFPNPDTSCDENVGKPFKRGFEFQPRLVIQGPCQIKKLRLMASDVAEDANGACLNDSTCRTLENCLPDTLSYETEGAPVRSA